MNFLQQLDRTALSPNILHDVTEAFLVAIQEQKKVYNREVDESQSQVCTPDLVSPEEKEEEQADKDQNDKKTTGSLKDEGHVMGMIHGIPIFKSQSLEVKTRLLYETVKLFNRVSPSVGQEKVGRDDGGPNDIKSLANESKGFEIFQLRVWISQELQ